MQWIILVAGLLMLFVLVRKSPPPVLESAAVYDDLKKAAQNARIKGWKRLCIPRRMLRQLERSLRQLVRLPDNELLPASAVLCENARFLQEEAARVILDASALPKLPFTADRKIRLWYWVRAVLTVDGASISRAQIENALEAWQSVQPMTQAELDALPVLLRAGLVEQLCCLANTCMHDQHALRAAKKVLGQSSRGCFRAARWITRRFADRPAFWERLLRTGEAEEWMKPFLPADRDLLHAERERQSGCCLKASACIASLREAAILPWDEMLEEASAAHQALWADEIYRSMDASSRKAYRLHAAAIARQSGFQEKDVCEKAVALGSGRALPASHVGYYLLDDGLPELLAQLHALTPWRRIRMFCKRRHTALQRVCTWSAFVAFIAVGFAKGLALWVLIPSAGIMVWFFRQAAWFACRRYSKKKTIPRIAAKQLSRDMQVLVVCPCVLSSVSNAIAMVKRLSVIHAAEPDEHLHFLLLGDFQDSLTAVSTADADIVAAARTAIEALCEGTGHPFFYLQRARFTSPGEPLYHARERKRGALEMILRLIQGRSIQDSLACATIDPAALQGQYRYVLVLQPQTILPPGSVLPMLGAMLHPLNRRQRFNGHMRGASVLQPCIQPAPHMLRTAFSRWADLPQADDFFSGSGFIDPEPFLNEAFERLPHGRLLHTEKLTGALAGCLFDPDISLYGDRAQDLQSLLEKVHQNTRALWQQLPFLLPFASKVPKNERFRLRRDLAACLIFPFQMLVMLYAAITGRNLLLALAALLPQLPLLFSDFSGIRQYITSLALLPCLSFVQTDAILRTILRLCTNRRLMAAGTPALFPGRREQSGMLFFSVAMTFAGLFAAFALLLDGALSGLVWALLWAAVPFIQPVAEQDRSQRKLPDGYMRKTLERLARSTLDCFETIVTPDHHALPPEHAQFEPNKGISRFTTPEAIGWYLCSLIACEKMRLLSANEMAARVDETLHSLEMLPRWHGLFYSRYDARQLAAASAEVSSAECGVLAACLMTCAQGVRHLLPALESKWHSLPSRLDALWNTMQLYRLYDPDAGLFRTGFDATQSVPLPRFHTQLAGPGLLLSYVALMLGQAPRTHWQNLGRQQVHGGALLSPDGSLSSYLVPLIFLPYVPGTLWQRSVQKALPKQRQNRLGGAFGVSECAYYAFDESMHYCQQAFGLPELALSGSVESNVLAAYASILSLSFLPRAAMASLQNMQRLGLEGPLGLWEAADFDPARTDGAPVRIVRSLFSAHQGMILCAICNALEDGLLSRLFLSLPMAEACRTLWEEPYTRPNRLIRHPVQRFASPLPPAAPNWRREASPLSFPIDAHLYHGANTTLMIDAQGGGFLQNGSLRLTRFSQDCRFPSGIRIYLRDTQSGAFWTATDCRLTRSVRFEAGQAVFETVHNRLQTELRIWIDPLDGACVYRLGITNLADEERQLEACSYLEPALCASGGADAADLRIRTARIDHQAIEAMCFTQEGKPLRLWHLLAADVPVSLFRIQTDRTAFLGRGRTVVSPRAMRMPISAIADSLGDMPDCCLSLRGQFALAGGASAAFTFVTQLNSAHDQPDAFLRRYAAFGEWQQSLSAAAIRAMVTIRRLGLDADALTSISRLTGLLACAGQPTAHISTESRLSPEALVTLAISSRVPFMLYCCLGALNEPMLRTLLNAQSFFGASGWETQLVVLVESCSRQAELAAEARRIIHTHQREGVLVLEGLDAEKCTLLRSTARAVFSAGGGPLDQQLSHITADLRRKPQYFCRADNRWKTELPPSDPLLWENGLGGFQKQTGDYQITLPPGRNTPAPWYNLLRGPAFTTTVCESGVLGSSAYGRALTIACEDPLSPQGGETFYLRDEQERLLWSPTRFPLGHHASVRITHGPGGSAFESSLYGIQTRIQVFSDSEHAAGLRIIHLHNTTQSTRELTFFHVCHLDSAGQTLLPTFENGCVSAFLPFAEGWAALCALDPQKCSAASMRAGLFHGLWGLAPFALSALTEWPQENGDTVFLAFSVKLEPGESQTLATAIVCDRTQEKLHETIQQLRTHGGTQRMQTVRRFWTERLSAMQFDLPDQALSLLLGRWLPYQALSAPGEAQALLPLLYLCPDEAPKHIMRFFSRNASAENALHRLLLTAQLVETTDDATFFTQALPKLENRTLLSCCLHLIDTLEYGAHALPLSLDANSTESVLLGMQLCEVIRRILPHCDSETSQRLTQRRQALLDALEREAWDGGWYLRGWDAAGGKIGSAQNETCSICLAEQVWAVLIGLSRERCEIAMENVWRLLYQRDAGLMLSFTPPFDNALPGTPSNGGQQTAEACLAMTAYHLLGQHQRAWELLGALLPTNHTATRQLAAHYRTPPYLLAPFVYTNPDQRGRALNHWAPSCAGLFWWVTVTRLLGLDIRGRELRLCPTLPDGWEELRITLRWGTSTYHLHAARNRTQAEADGAVLSNDILTLTDDGRIHEAFFAVAPCTPS